jgi:hypothetical protein
MKKDMKDKEKAFQGDFSQLDEAKKILKGKGGRKRRFDSPAALAKACKSYFNSCWRPKVDADGRLVRTAEGKLVFEQFRPYTMSGLALFLGISSETLRKYSKEQEYGEIISTARQYVEMYTEEQLMQGIATAKVSLEHNFGWNKAEGSFDEEIKIVLEKAEGFEK